MYEAEVNSAVESIETLPADIRKRFAEFRDRIAARTILPWGEHCTECVWPTCYTTCELYSRRQDGACRLFAEGMVRVDHKEGLSPYLLKIQFKQWGKLWTVGNLNLRSLSQAAKQESFNMAMGAVGRNLPLPGSFGPRLLTKISYLRRQSAENALPTDESPDYFLLECYNPNPRNIALTFTVRLRIEKETRPFQSIVWLSPGYNRTKVPFSEISQSVDTSRPFEVEIVPNDSDNTVLYFGLMDFVKEHREVQRHAESGRGTKQFKCIVWDLDNTFWEGTLVEDGPEKLRIRQAVVDVIKQTDQKGILHSIASKNNHDDAMKVLQQHGVDDYFLYPQIGWQPKSQSIAHIAQLLNIAVDAIAFVDDQAFEREEVKASLPEVVVIDAAECLDLPDRPECLVPVTAESKRRRLMYREQEQRQIISNSYQGDYLAFLRDCRMEITITSLSSDNLKRVYELAQRTNQLNFSGNRYQESQLADIMGSSFLETYVIDCRDRFGNYGIVGFGLVDTRAPRLLDLMFSCRIQGKRVEHAVLSFLLKRFVLDKRQDFYANYRQTPKNAPGGKVFEEVGFQQITEEAGLASLVFRKETQIPDDHAIEIKIEGYSSMAIS